MTCPHCKAKAGHSPTCPLAVKDEPVKEAQGKKEFQSPGVEKRG